MPLADLGRTLVRVPETLRVASLNWSARQTVVYLRERTFSCALAPWDVPATGSSFPGD